ncbi:MAG: tricarboxylic transporter [Betaproteobacteria bacterium]|nr:MAG: tricarboxylic transporter [Betaproteobacteria bacterium]
MLDPLLVAAGALLQPQNIFLVAVGNLTGLLFGLLPGITVLAAMSILLPFTIGQPPISAMYLFIGIMGSGPFGGAVTSILFNIPGEPTSAAACFDGYPMTRRGEAAKALGLAAASAVLASILGLAVLIGLIPLVRAVVYAFGPPEFFMLLMFGLATVAIAAPGNTLKGIVTAGLGVLISLIGYDPITGVLRFGLGSANYLWDGVNLPAFFVGVFAVGEVISYYVAGGTITQGGARVHSMLEGTLQGIRELFRHPRVFLQGSIVGSVVGILPGIGGTVSNFLSYTLAMQTSKTRDSYGKGNPEGLVAAMSATNEDTGALLPTVAFGIPGSASTALLLGALILHGFNPGPLFIQEHMEIVWALVLGLLLANIIAATVGLAGANLLARLTTLDVKFLVPTILVISLLGAYADRENAWDVALAIGSGVLAYGLSRFGYPIVTLVIGFVMGRLAERAFAQSLQMHLDPLIFFKRPVSLALFVLMVVAFAVPLVRNMRKKK